MLCRANWFFNVFSSCLLIHPTQIIFVKANANPNSNSFLNPNPNLNLNPIAVNSSAGELTDRNQELLLAHVAVSEFA